MWLSKSGEPPGHPEHNIGYDHELIEICPECSGATLEKLKHDCFDFEDVWDQYEWYELAPDDGARVRALAARCEQPLNPFCNCFTHNSLRESAGSLPTSSWNAVFEAGAHRHRVTISDGTTPAFTLIGQAVQFQPVEHTQAVVMVNDKPVPKRVLTFVGIGWPLTYATALALWFWRLDVSWVADALYVVGMVPVTFFAAGIFMALPALFKPVSAKPADDRGGDAPRVE